ncbi:hypothetical protein ZEAMMB73_Zm00001d048921 [Zea mays]|nr:hypothetical protein ZEAMMB73_Zm00001d048921 [Zea mays]
MAKGGRGGLAVRWQGARTVEHGGGGSGRVRAPREARSTGWTDAGTGQAASPAQGRWANATREVVLRDRGRGLRASNTNTNQGMWLGYGVPVGAGGGAWASVHTQAGGLGVDASVVVGVGQESGWRGVCGVGGGGMIGGDGGDSGGAGTKLRAAAAAPDPCIPDDALVETFGLLPANSVHRFKCVSKAWCGLITDPLHRQRFA